jgi:transposase
VRVMQVRPVTESIAHLPNDIVALKAIIAEQFKRDAHAQAQLTAAHARLSAASHTEQLLLATIKTLQLQLAVLRRVQYGRSSEKLDEQVAQLELQLEDAQEALGAIALATPVALEPLQAMPDKPARKPRTMPEALPREHQRLEPLPIQSDCSHCTGNHWRCVGEDVTEQLHYVPASFKVLRTVRPKYSCAQCQGMVQAPAPSRPIDKGYASASLLAQVLMAKYADHLPLYRQEGIYARAGVPIATSTMADWVGGCSALLAPLTQAIKEYVLQASKLHTDDTPVPVLQPGKKSTKTARLWTYVRDDRGSGSSEPPAVWYAYTPDRKAIHPAEHLKQFTGVLQADAYAGYETIYKVRANTLKPILEAGCWAHARRKFYDIAQATDSPMARQALERIGQLYEIEAAIKGKPPDERERYRHEHTTPRLAALKAWLEIEHARVSSKSELALAIRYTTGRWSAMTRFAQDGRLEIDNNIAERSIRPIAVGKKNWMFAGSDNGGERAAAIYSLIETAKHNGLNAQAYLTHVLDVIADTKINQVRTLLPWNLDQDIKATMSMRP